jgi:hypothetical protein
MSTIETLDQMHQVRAGDWVVLSHPDYGRVEGEARALTGSKALFVAGICIRDLHGGPKPSNGSLIEARRQKPELPTTLSLIRGTVHGRALVLLGPDDDGDWHHISGRSADYEMPATIDDFEDA